MNSSDSITEITRIRGEYERRAREIPQGFYHWSQPANYFLQAYAARGCIRLLHRHGLFPLAGCSVADIGCGLGIWLLEFSQWGATELAGIDLRQDAIEEARRRLPSADLRCGDASQLPWPDASFDLVSQFVMFTSILDPVVKRQIAQELQRVAKPGGGILWYDFRFNNPKNRNVQGIRAAEIRSLFSGCEVELSRVTLAPPVARRVVPVSWTAGSILEAMPFLCSHYVALIRKPAIR